MIYKNGPLTPSSEQERERERKYSFINLLYGP